ncbi:MAG: RND transporter [Moraxellaceae bacterium]|nr:MAG: RND transporter [Moraxellaceae bacterium]
MIVKYAGIFRWWFPLFHRAIVNRVTDSQLLKAILISIGGLLGACTTIGPEFQQPQVEWLAQWQQSIAATSLSTKASLPKSSALADSIKNGAVPAASGLSVSPEQVNLQTWWLLFEDPVLNRLIEINKEENLTLRGAGLRIFESRALLGIAGSSLYPQVQQATGAINYVNSKSPAGAGDFNYTSYQTGVNLAWEMDFWGRFRRGIESADAGFFASVANHADMQVLISAQVADLYYAYRTTEVRITIAKKNAAIQKRSYELTEQLFESGEDSELDLQQAKTQYLATLSSIPQLEIVLVSTRNALTTLMGRPPGNVPELVADVDVVGVAGVAKEQYTLPMASSVNFSHISANQLLQRPDVRSKAWQVAMQSAQIGIAQADYYPSISLLGTLGWSGNNTSGSSNTSSLVAGPALRWNIFDYGRIENNIRLQDARLQQLIESFQASVIQAAREVDDAVYSVIKTAEQQVLVDESVTAAQRALDIANIRYKEGYAGFQRVLDAQRALFSQAERQVINQGNHISAIISLYKGLGGGWIAMPVDQLIPENTRSTMAKRSDWGELLTAPLPISEGSASTGVVDD